MPSGLGFVFLTNESERGELMFTIKIADIVIRIENQYEYVQLLCKDYIVSNETPPELTVCVTEDEILKEIKNAENPVTPAYAEGVCTYRIICKQLPIKYQS